MEKILNVTESAKEMKVSKVTIYNWIASGLPAEKKFRGRRSYHLIKLSDLESFLAKWIEGK